MAGVVLGSGTLIERIWHSLVALGPVPDPFAAWLLLRGLRTLPIRIERHNATAASVEAFLEGHSSVERVHYPGLASHAQHELARRQMLGGVGGWMSFELRGGFEAAQRFMSRLTIPTRAVSFGGFESLATQPAAMWAGSIGEANALNAGIGFGLIKLSVGLEHGDDLITDLENALAVEAP